MITTPLDPNVSEATLDTGFTTEQRQRPLITEELATEMIVLRHLSFSPTILRASDPATSDTRLSWFVRQEAHALVRKCSFFSAALQPLRVYIVSDCILSDCCRRERWSGIII